MATFALLLLLLALATASARASGTVTNCTEESLRVALTGGGRITFTCDGTIPLTSTIIINQETVLDGTGHTPGLSNGQTTNQVRLFLVQPGASLTLRHLSLSGGNLVNTNTTARANGSAALGAAIYNDRGLVTLDGCTISDHTVAGGPGGDGVDQSDDGGKGGPGFGGAVYNNAGWLTVTNTVFSGNTATGGAGGRGAAGLAIGNGSQGGAGGTGGSASGAAIYNAGNGFVSIFSSTFSSNNVAGSPAGAGGPGVGVIGFPGLAGDPGVGAGAALFNESGTVSVVNSTFIDNFGVGAAGTAGVPGAGLIQAVKGTTGGNAFGAGLYNRAGMLSMTNCTLVENSLQGGAGGAGATGTPGVIEADGSNGGDGGAAFGAGVFTDSNATTIIVNCTFSANRVVGGEGAVGGQGSGLGSQGRHGASGPTAGAAIFNQGGTVRLRNSVLAQGSFGGNVGGSISDEGFNLSSDATANLSAQGSRNQINALFGPLASFGSGPETLTLSTNSPAVNAIADPGGNGSPLFDQRNAQRVDPYDIGAFELNGTLPAPSLQAQVSSNQVVLSWQGSGEYVLQSSTDLSDTNGWRNVTLPNATTGPQKATFGTDNQATFYRLTKP